MTAYQRVLLGDLGRLLYVPSLLTLPALAVGALWEEWYALPGLLVTGLLSFILARGLCGACQLESDANAPRC